MMQEDGTMAAGEGKRAWMPFLWIVLASAVAHLWCLGSVLYLDDFPQIRDNELLRNGRFWENTFLSWTTAWQWLQFRLFGQSPVGFHAVNWLLHTAVACVLFALGRDMVRGRWPEGVALFGALLFAVHPLGSEIPNYVRTQDIAWVTLFSLLAAWAALRYVRDGGWELVGGMDGEIPVFQRTDRWKKLLWCALAVAGAMFSKGPGLFHAVMAVAMIVLAFFPWEIVKAWRRLGVLVLGAAVLVFVVGWATGMLEVGLRAMEHWKEPRFTGHGYTVARVFWEFAWRGVVPVGLSADHLIAETLVPAGKGLWTVPDKIAQVAALGMLALTGLGLWMACRERWKVPGVCLTLFVGTMLFRVLYLIPEFMPEYRIYPGLPWFCLGAAIVLSAIWRWIFAHVSPRVPALILLALLAALSAKRAFLWHDLDKLMADVLKQYPAQARAIWELHKRDTDAGKWQAVIDRQENVFPEIKRKFIASLLKTNPVRELPTGHFSLAEVACAGRYALAVAHARSPDEGILLIDRLQAFMVGLGIDPATNPVHWEFFARDKALVLETGGNYAAALKALERQPDKKGKVPPPLWPRDYERIRKKLEAAQP
ncbi:MAG: hypothetical protein EOP88_20515 [Verrucomicrobiaceae bacterium]|nr:MAG: hypothetical protein EOP88_20515 [Verrucomicrobiaceae bacterium]